MEIDEMLVDLVNGSDMLCELLPAHTRDISNRWIDG